MMTVKNKKQFGVWMDSHHATIIGKENSESEVFTILGHVNNEGAEKNSSEKNENNSQKALSLKFFKEISALMQNAEEVHVTGTGIAQEQFIHYLAETPQFKKTVANETTSNKMEDDKLVEYISQKFN
ncbi:MAG: hypothetical protein ABJA37_08575 [Ferruginibacter sp.]